MHHIVSIFLFLLENKHKLVNCTRIDTIEMEWINKDITFPGQYREIVDQPRVVLVSGLPEWHDIFDYESNEDISAECTVIEWSSGEWSEESFGVLYQNIIGWFNNILHPEYVKRSFNIGEPVPRKLRITNLRNRKEEQSVEYYQ